MAIIHLLPPLEAAIWNKASKGEPKRKGSHRGAGGLAAPRGKVKIPAETILLMRRMHEIERKPHVEVARAFPDFDPSYVRRVLNYELRANLRVR